MPSRPLIILPPRPDEFDGLVRYEIHLDRKLERMLAMLVRLKEIPLGKIGE
jgi:hypothetical protein